MSAVLLVLMDCYDHLVYLLFYEVDYKVLPHFKASILAKLLPTNLWCLSCVCVCLVGLVNPVTGGSPAFPPASI